jgi:hypothetical protein
MQHHGKARANEILDDIDKRYVQNSLIYDGDLTTLFRIAIVSPFSGLRRFPQGRGFKQWTGDDSKALMKVRSPSLCC